MQAKRGVRARGSSDGRADRAPAERAEVHQTPAVFYRGQQRTAARFVGRGESNEKGSSDVRKPSIRGRGAGPLRAEDEKTNTGTLSPTHRRVSNARGCNGALPAASPRLPRGTNVHGSQGWEPLRGWKGQCTTEGHLQGKSWWARAQMLRRQRQGVIQGAGGNGKCTDSCAFPGSSLSQGRCSR